MEVLEDGYVYELYHQENPGAEYLKFFHRGIVPNQDGIFEIISEGISNEDVIEVLIHRMHFLQKQLPCKENTKVISKLTECLDLLDERTKDRQDRGVWGKLLP
ncbi:MAG: hypothetical protein KDC85_18200 [Saprospiraceae bacterium]|nr:hypothetical protein [Saprospiraceae bacterium]MCB9325867.1 hypothetical protein [Lewinellaceae bacterium]